MEHPGRAVGQLFFYVLVIAGIIWFIVYLVRRNRGGAGPNQARWQHAVQVCGNDPRYRLGHVTSIAQVHPQRGTSAWVTWHGAPQPQGTWFENAYPPAGAWVVVSGAPAPDGQTFHVTALHDVFT